MVDGELRLSYAQFFERADRWSSALQRMGVQQGDRVENPLRTLSPLQPAQLQ